MCLIRAGKKPVYYDKYLSEKRIYLSWEGYNSSLQNFSCRKDFHCLVRKEKDTDNKTSVSTGAGQLYSFVCEMKCGDYVLIPSKGSHTYVLAKVKSDYKFIDGKNAELRHYRDVDIIIRDIPKGIFQQSLIYSLGESRTLFSIKQENEVLKVIREWGDDNETSV